MKSQSQTANTNYTMSRTDYESLVNGYIHRIEQYLYRQIIPSVVNDLCFKYYLQFDKHATTHYNNATQFVDCKKFDEARQSMINSFEFGSKQDMKRRIYFFAQDIMFESRKFKELESFLHKLLDVHPYNVDIYFWIANACREQQNFNKAEISFKKVLELDPNEVCIGYPTVLMELNKVCESIEMAKNNVNRMYNSVTLFEYGQVLEKMKDYEKAIEYFKKCINLSVENFDNAENKVYNCLIKLNKNEEALLWLHELASLNSKNVCYVLQYAKELRRLKKRKEAIVQFEKCLDLKRDNIAAFCGIIWCFIEQKRYDEALEYANKMCMILPECVSSYTMKSHVFCRMKQWNKCKEFRKKALEIKPKDIKYQLNYLEMLFVLCEHDEAVIFCEEIIKSHPNSSRAWRESSLCYVLTFNMKKALEYVQKAMSLEPETTENICDYAGVLVELGQFDKAKEILEKHLKIERTARILAMYGLVLREEGKYFYEAIYYYKESISLDADENSNHVWTRKGNLFWLKKEYENAVKCYQKSLDLFYANPFTHYYFGVAFTSVGKFDEAYSSFKNSLKVRPRYPKCHHDLGLLLIEKMSLYDEGIYHLQKANKIDPENEMYSLSLQKFEQK